MKKNFSIQELIAVLSTVKVYKTDVTTLKQEMKQALKSAPSFCYNEALDINENLYQYADEHHFLIELKSTLAAFNYHSYKHPAILRKDNRQIIQNRALYCNMPAEITID